MARDGKALQSVRRRESTVTNDRLSVAINVWWVPSPQHSSLHSYQHTHYRRRLSADATTAGHRPQPLLYTVARNDLVKSYYFEHSAVNFDTLQSTQPVAFLALRKWAWPFWGQAERRRCGRKLSIVAKTVASRPDQQVHMRSSYSVLVN